MLEPIIVDALKRSEGEGPAMVYHLGELLYSRFGVDCTTRTVHRILQRAQDHGLIVSKRIGTANEWRLPRYGRSEVEPAKRRPPRATRERVAPVATSEVKPAIPSVQEAVVMRLPVTTSISPVVAQTHAPILAPVQPVLESSPRPAPTVLRKPPIRRRQDAPIPFSPPVTYQPEVSMPRLAVADKAEEYKVIPVVQVENPEPPTAPVVSPDPVKVAAPAPQAEPQPVVEAAPLNPVVTDIASQLGEKGEAPLKQLSNALDVCGAELLQSVLAETLEVERNGGMPTGDGKRRRTPGGVYFHVLRTKVTPEDWKRIVPKIPKAPAAVAKSPTPSQWKERSAAVAEALSAPGKCFARARARASLARVRERVGHTVVVLETRLDPQQMPRQLPRPDEAPSLAAQVCVAEWQWIGLNGRARSNLVLEAQGPCHIDDGRQNIVVLAGEVALVHGDPDSRHGPRVGLQVALTGRPGRVVEMGSSVVLAMIGDRQPVPQRGLPPAPRMATVYLVYIPMVDWRGVQSSLSPTSQIAVRGRCWIDRETGSMAVFADAVKVVQDQRPGEAPTML